LTYVYFRYLDQEAQRKTEQQEQLLRREEVAKKRVADDTKMKREAIMRREVTGDILPHFEILYHIEYI